MKLTRIALAVFALGALQFATAAWPQAYPSKPIRLVVTNAPGGATDILGRLVADRLGQRFGQQVLVDNKPGAGGNIAGTFLARAVADGHTLLLVNHPGVTTAPVISKDAGFDQLKDFAPV